MNRRLFVKSLAVMLAFAASTAFAQSSGRPIRIVVSLLAGSAIDFQARLLAPHLSASLGQTVVVENKAGGKDIIAMMDVIKSAPDGHTLYMGSQSPLAINVAHGEEPALRSAQGCHAHFRRRPGQPRSDREIGLPGEDAAGVHRLRQKESGQGEHRLLHHHRAEPRSPRSASWRESSSWRCPTRACPRPSPICLAGA